MAWFKQDEKNNDGPSLAAEHHSYVFWNNKRRGGTSIHIHEGGDVMLPVRISGCNANQCHVTHSLLCKCEL